MQLLEGIAGILAIFLYILILAALSFGILFGIAAVIGVVGSVLSIPLLYVLPDVGRFLLLASGGAPDDRTPPRCPRLSTNWQTPTRHSTRWPVT
ncbi:hypothetical protein NDI54_07810 [Haloarcula sp. S1AR25-5A]|uniref:Uncharacterized protein n=1 Tax=Haloarcula terrestris TaxID=2950533 RepID=A0AAE4EYT2_9EURY|nr:hypothetical protein [Haloarcula terrestris]MDS0221251.1 hypothetical protein [Haloarcula terrestris]